MSFIRVDCLFIESIIVSGLAPQDSRIMTWVRFRDGAVQHKAMCWAAQAGGGTK
jgi:hypothetical protein